ncbi:hypothetical protein HDR66_02120, partial [bacterium]|nr:hypothetical protein [bacterium]
GTTSTSGTGTARAGSMRVTGTSGRVGTSANVLTPSASGTSAGRAATSQRLSIGKVLTGSTAVSRPINSGSGSSGSNPSLSGSADVDLSELTGQINDLKGEIDGLRNEFGTSDQRIENLENQLIELQDKIAALDDVEGLQIAIDELRGEIDALGDGFDTTQINQDIADINDNLTAIQTIINALGKDADEIKKNLYESIVNNSNFSNDVKQIVENDVKKFVEENGGTKLPDWSGMDRAKVYTIGVVDGELTWLEVERSGNKEE